jgi:hypothetical protein
MVDALLLDEIVAGVRGGDDLGDPVRPHVDDRVLVLGRLGQALAEPAGDVGAQGLAGVEPDGLLDEEPPASRAVAPAGAAVVRRQGQPQAKLSATVTEPRLLLHELAVEELVASPLVGQREEIGLGRRPIQFRRHACHRGEHTANAPG